MGRTLAKPIILRLRWVERPRPPELNRAKVEAIPIAAVTEVMGFADAQPIRGWRNSNATFPPPRSLPRSTNPGKIPVLRRDVRGGALVITITRSRSLHRVRRSALPELADTAPNRKSRIRNSLQPSASSARRNLCSHRRTGKRQ